jgi:flavodoxin I
LTMKKIALIYWPKLGNTEKAAYKILEKFDKGMVDIFTITSINTAEFGLYDAFIIGGSTTGADNWEDAHKDRWTEFFQRLEKADVKDKPFAIFGLGDQILYPYNFVDGMAIIKEQFELAGARHTGLWPVEGYEFRDSNSIENGVFLGLALDLDKQAEMTAGRIDKWTAQLRKEFGL